MSTTMLAPSMPRSTILAITSDPGAAQVRLQLSQRPFNGLLTNDKFCLSRAGWLVLSWWRYPLRRREQEQAQRGTVPDTEGDRGGAHVAPVAGPPLGADGARRWDRAYLLILSWMGDQPAPAHLLATATGDEP
jgi:hypothetical protein